MWNAIRFMLYIIIAIGFLIILTITSMRKNKENKTSIMLRIFTNYVQLIGVALSFDIKYPNTINYLMTPFQRIGSSNSLSYSDI